ncbi:MAG: hypothetical protein IJY39_14465 [Clostridia bacterium]|nr:hypothetical protein [Clostridia bacterium]
MNNNANYNKLLGALIGLARATDGNEDLVTCETYRLILEGLRFGSGETDAEAIPALLTSITEEKKRLVPNCFYCMASCGRTDDYDVQALQNADADIREIKLEILKKAALLAQTTATKADDAQTEKHGKLCITALFAVGMDDWGAALLRSVLDALPSEKQLQA